MSGPTIKQLGWPRVTLWRSTCLYDASRAARRAAHPVVFVLAPDGKLLAIDARYGSNNPPRTSGVFALSIGDAIKASNGHLHRTRLQALKATHRRQRSRVREAESIWRAVELALLAEMRKA